MSESMPGAPEPSLSFLFYSLGTQGMVSLGLVKDPRGGEEKQDLTQAKYSIDLLEMLREKTEGNRTEEETKILLSLLFDLRMKYVEASRSRGGVHPAP